MLSWFRKSGPEPFDAAEAVRLHAAGAVILVDVREPDEVAQSGKATGALVIPLGEIAFRADPASPGFLPAFGSGRPVALYCVSGARSGRAGQILRGLGYAEVANFGGLSDWIAAGGPTEPGP
jgi:rhodanese-related sulfurtransferase